MSQETSSATAAQEARRLRTIIGVGLASFLTVIVGWYIYYGMSVARTTHISVDEALPDHQLGDAAIDHEAEAILQALESAGVADPETAQQVVEALGTDVLSQNTHKTEILEAIGQPGE